FGKWPFLSPKDARALRTARSYLTVFRFLMWRPPVGKKCWDKRVSGKPAYLAKHATDGQGQIAQMLHSTRMPDTRGYGVKDGPNDPQALQILEILVSATWTEGAELEG